MIVYRYMEVSILGKSDEVHDKEEIPVVGFFHFRKDNK